MSDNCIYVDVNGMLRRWNGTRWEDVKAISSDPVEKFEFDFFGGWLNDSAYSGIVKCGRAYSASVNVKRTVDSFTKTLGQEFDFLRLPSGVTPPDEYTTCGALYVGGNGCPLIYKNSRVYAIATNTVTLTEGSWYFGHMAWVA